MSTPLPSEDPAGNHRAVPTPDSELWHRDPLTSRVYLSAEWKALLGYEEHELGCDFNEFQSRLHPEDREGILRTLHANLTKPDFEFAVGFRLRHRDGSYRWIPARGAQAGAPIEPPGQLPGPKGAGLATTPATAIGPVAAGRALAVSVDPTDKATVAEGFHDATVTIRRKHWSRARRDVLIIAILCIVVLVAAHLLEVFEHFSAWVLTYREFALDEIVTVFVFLAFALIIYSIRRKGEFKIEVTERQRAEKALRVSRDELEVNVQQRTAELSKANEALRAEIAGRGRAEVQVHLQVAALTATANEVIITDRHGIIQWVNPAFTKAIGYTLEEAVGQNPRILKSGKHDHAFYKNLWATILRGEVWRGEIVNRKKDQSLITELATITPVKDEHGAITHFIAIKQDISEKKLLEAKFLRAQRLEGLGALAGGVAHDLNNVLAPILMASELLKMQSTDPRTRELLGMIESNSQRGAGMIRQILAFARGTAGDKVALQVKHLLKDISRMMKDTFPPKIRAELHMDEKLSLVQGEPTELYQVLLNLCVNARDAMPGGGTITVTATNVLLDETYAHLSHEAPPGHYVVLTVEDTGSGIPPEIQAKIFDAFFTTKGEGKGTGLGLATVKDIITRHNGFIHLYSEVGVGTQFKIYLPVVVGEEAASDTTFLTLPTGHGELILAVDDEAAVREIVKATLEANGYRVVTADDGTQAVARFVEHLSEVQLLLTDIQMPHMDGMATIRALRNIRPDLRVIAASGLTTHQQALKVTGINVQGFIAKPFTAASLLLAVDAALHPK